MLLYLLCLDTCGLFGATPGCGCYLRLIGWCGLFVVCVVLILPAIISCLRLFYALIVSEVGCCWFRFASYRLFVVLLVVVVCLVCCFVAVFDSGCWVYLVSAFGLIIVVRYCGLFGLWVIFFVNSVDLLLVWWRCVHFMMLLFGFYCVTCLRLFVVYLLCWMFDCLPMC